MTNSEFSNSFDTLLNSYATQFNFGEQDSKTEVVLDEYEKSLFLTKAQEELVLSLYNGRNSSLQSFEETEELRRYLSNLIEETTETPITTNDGSPLGIESSSKFFTLPTDLWFITYESVDTSNSMCGTGGSIEVVPVTQDEYHRVKNNPFRGINNRRALRLDLADGVVEIVCKYTITSYYLRYLRKPSPIILINLENDLSINGENTETTCELHEALHQKILDRAVILALQSKGYNTNNNREQ